jgi:hypothetical protein
LRLQTVMTVIAQLRNSAIALAKADSARTGLWGSHAPVSGELAHTAKPWPAWDE